MLAMPCMHCGRTHAARQCPCSRCCATSIPHVWGLVLLSPGEFMFCRHSLGDGWHMKCDMQKRVVHALPRGKRVCALPKQLARVRHSIWLQDTPEGQAQHTG